ncbi:serine hydrolase FSH [Xylariaceae sp. FL0594]|nr:serine hydrolase FSH [Xylariaceae sp. FL0594]
MKFLCLPGAYGSADKFQVQLAPLVNELLSDGSALFRFINAPCEAVPPAGFEDFFGKPPYYRFIEPDEKKKKPKSDKKGSREEEDGTTDVLSRIRDFPQCDTPEDTMRELFKEGVASSVQSTRRAIQFLLDILDKEGPFEGIIGYSEGATVAGTLLLAEQDLLRRTGREPMIRCAVFFAGWPPLDPGLETGAGGKGFGSMVLADESDVVIAVRTVHIIGSLDPYVAGSMALYNICDPDLAHIFDHGKGHTLPREKAVIKELGDVIRNMIKECLDTESGG